MATEALATYGSESVLKTIFTVFNAVSFVINLICEALIFFVFGVLVEVLQVSIFCSFNKSSSLSSYPCLL